MIQNLRRYPSSLILGVLLLIALLLRIPLLTGSFWLDEAAQALESARPFSQQLLIRDDFQPPLLHYLVHFALYLGEAEWWLRLIGALIPGLVTIYFTFKIGELIGGKRVAILATLLLATSSFHIIYSQELRQYSLPASLATASWYFLFLIWKRKRTPTTTHLAVFALLSSAGLYSSYLYPFVLIGQAVWVWIFQKKNVTLWAGAVLVTALLFAPWVPSFLDQLDAGTQLRSDLPGWSTVVSPTQFKALPLVAAKFIYGVSDVGITPFVVFSFLILVITTSLMLKNVTQLAKERELFLSLLIWFVIPILTAWIVSFWVPVLQPKRVLFCLPAFYVFVSSFVLVQVRSLNKLKLLSAPVILILCLLGINLISTVQYWTTPDLQRENWRSLIATIQTQYPDYSTTLFAFPEPFAPWRWYAGNSYPALATGELLLSNETALETVKRASAYDHVLLFDYLRDLSDPERKLDRLLIEYGYKETGLLEYPAIGFVRIYSKPTAVISYN